MAAGSIIVDLLMRTGSFETDTKRGQKALRELKKEAQDAGKVIGASLAAVGIATAYAVQRQLEAADAAGKAAQAAGVTVESYTALAYAAQLSDVSTEGLNTALKELNKSLASNDPAFKQLGVQVRGTNGEIKATDSVLAELADKFAKLPDGPTKAALAVQLFGKAGTQLIPLLNSGSAGIAKLTEEAKRLGVVIDSETAAAAEEFNDNITRLKKTSEGLQLQLAKELLPTLSDFSARTLKNAKDFGTLRGAFVAFYEIVLGGTETADVLEKQSKTTSDTIKGLREEIEKLTKRGVGEDFQGGILGQLRAELARAEQDSKRTSQAITDALNEAAGRSQFGRGVGFTDPRIPKDRAPDLTKPQKEKVSEAQRYLETLQKQSEELLNQTTVEKVLNDIAKKRIDGLTPELRKAIVAQAEYNDLQKAQKELRDSEVGTTTAIARAQLDNIDALTKGNQALRDEIALIGLDEIGQIGVERARISSIRALKEEERARKAALGVADEQLQAIDAEIAALREREELLGKKIDRSLEQRSIDAAKKSGEGIKDTLGDSIEQGILEGFRKGGDFTDVFLNELKAQFAKTILRPLIQPVADAGNSLIGDILGAVVSSFSSSGITTGDSPLSQTGEQIRGRRAGGGDSNPNPFGALLVGEKGPELFRPSTSGRIIPNDALGGTRGGGVTIKNYGADITPQRKANGDIELIVRAVKADMVRDLASGTGDASRALKSRGLNLSASLPRRS